MTTAKLALDRATRRRFQASPQILGMFGNHDGRGGSKKWDSGILLVEALPTNHGGELCDSCL